MIELLKQYLVFLLISLFSSLVWGQSVSIKGIIVDEQKLPVIGATVQLNEQHNTLSDENGKFSLTGLESGQYKLVISFLGFEKYEKQIRINSNENLSIKIELRLDIQQLNTFILTEKSIAEETREKGYAVDVIEAKSVKNISYDLNQVLKTTPGINIRESGGLGSDFKLSLNGLSGNQIRYFIDGVPMENFGSALSLNNIPVNQIERLEVYKGVVPIALGADALGGAINIVSGYKKKSYLDASYSFGSFNTHKASLNGQYANSNKGYYLKLLSFFNHSDNDYEMKGVPLYDLELGNKLGEIDIKRFNDAYTSGMVLAEAGLFDKVYADLIAFKVTHARNEKNYQHPDNNILRPMGGFKTKNRSTLLSLNYKKSFGRLSLGAYLLGGKIEEDVIDSSSFKYNWSGDKIQRAEDDPKGELFERRTFFQLTDNVLRSQIHVQYDLRSLQRLNFSISQNLLKREGKDDVDELNRSFATPNTIQKHILGFSYSIHNSPNTLEATAFGKQYFFNGLVTSFDFEQNEVETKPTLSHIGVGLALSYKPSESITLKTSYEKAYRLPETYEILGNGVYILPNSGIEPEQSHNINIGGRFKERVYRFSFSQEVKLFYRKSEKFIRFNPTGPFGSYENLNSVNTVGIEGGVSVQYDGLVELQLNGTYQNLTDQTEFDEGLRNTNYKSRIPNIPYLFGNLRLGVKPLPNGKHKNFAIYWNVRYVHEFFLAWENYGNIRDKNIIPAQLIHGLDIEYAMMNGRYNLSASFTNLSNELVYDNFNIQKPGRAFYLKVRYFLSKQQS